jgi:hypothetical protein
MKKVIELLEAIQGKLKTGPGGVFYAEQVWTARRMIDEGLAELKAPPRWETPEQWEKLTGKTWSDTWPVWCISDEEEPKWRGHSYRKAKKIARVNDTVIICANFDGSLPPDDWMPEDEEGKEKRRCRVCGCTDDDCHQCIEKTGEPCYWVEEDLCSACGGKEDAKFMEWEKESGA